LRRLPPTLWLATLLTACPLPNFPWGDDGPVAVDVPAGRVFAAELAGDEASWWILDPVDGAILDQGVTHPFSLTVNLQDAAGAYVTSPTLDVAPAFAVRFEGSVTQGGVFSYLETNEASFTDLRLGDGSAMAARHAALLAGAATLQADFQADLDSVKDRLARLAHDEVVAARAKAECGLSLLHAVGTVDAVDDGTAGQAAWIDTAAAMASAVNAEANLDLGTANATSLSLDGYLVDEQGLQAQIEACIPGEPFADAIDLSMARNFPSTAIEDWEYDGRKFGSTVIDDPAWALAEEAFEVDLDGFSAEADAAEDCVLALAEEPELVVDLIEPAPYEAIEAEATALEAELDEVAAGCEAALIERYGDWIESDLPSGALAPTAWADAEAHAMATLTALLGPTLVSDPEDVVEAEAVEDLVTIENSSFDACANPTWSIQINVAGLGLAVGTPFADTIRGADVDDGFEVIVGLWGDDCLNGLKGHELILGGRGDDEIHGGDQHEILLGGSGDDTIWAGEGEDYAFTIPATPPFDLVFEIGSLAFGGKGDDVINGGGPDEDEDEETSFGYIDLLFGDGLSASTIGDDSVDGGGGIDFLFGQGGDDTLRNRRAGRIQIAVPETAEAPATTKDILFGSFFFGGRGDDTIVGSRSHDLVFGNRDNDDLSGEEGVDLMFGALGDDAVGGGDFPDLLFGGRGDDVVACGDGPDLAFGSQGADEVHGEGGIADLLFGGAEGDLVTGGDGIDGIFGSQGADNLYGGAGIADLIFAGAEGDNVYGESGQDLIFGSAGRDRIDGGADIDLAFGGAEVDIVQGGDGIDVLFGNKDDDWINGNGDFDIAFGGDDADRVFGGDDVDALFGNLDDDCVWGEDGVDLAFGNDGDDLLFGGAGVDLLMGNDGDDVLLGESDPNLLAGGDGEDVLLGGPSIDVAWGNAGDDLIYGNTGLDLLYGGDDVDCVDGEDGFDILGGGNGDDLLLDGAVSFGKAGNDALPTTLCGFGGDGDDTVATSGSGLFFLKGNEGADAVWIDASAGLTLAFGGDGVDTLSAPGAATVGSGGSRTFLFGNSGNDNLQISKGKGRAFGNSDDDAMCADADGSASNDDERDFVFGNSGNDTLAGDDSDKRDYLSRGAGSDPARIWDGTPTSTWFSLHTPPSFGTCAAPPEAVCDRQPPADVGAPKWE
jgi:Ca2+-binding RTX toxin-like protein